FVRCDRVVGPCWQAGDMCSDKGKAGSLSLPGIRRLIAQVMPADAVEEEHRRQALAWLDSTGDIFRRVKPCTPDPHLVSYFVVIDHQQDAVLLVDHRRAGLWLPTGGHVEP